MSKKFRGTRIASAISCGVALGLALSACGGGDSGGPTGGGGGGGQAGDGAGTIRFAWWGSDPRHEATQKIIDNFNQDHEDITVKGEFSDWSGYWNKLATMTAAGNAPDVITMDGMYIQEYAGRGSLVDLTTLDNLDLSKFPESALASGSYKGGFYGLTTGQNAFGVMANVDLFKKAGVELPNDKTWTWEDYYSISRKLDDKLPAAAGTTYGAQYVDLKIWLRQQGQSLYDVEAGTVGYETPAVTLWFEHLVQVREQGGGVSASEYTESQSGSFEAGTFAQGEAAMGWYWSPQLGALEEASGDDIRILRVPSMSGKASENGAYYKAGMYWSISSQSKDQAAAATFVHHLANSPEAAKKMGFDRGVPANPEMVEAIEPNLSETDKAVASFLEKIEPEMAEAPAPPPVGASANQAVIKRYVAEVLHGKLTPQQAAKQMTIEIENNIK